MTSGPLDFVAPLFVPGHRPDRFEKAARSGADAIIIDLEDAVPSADKERARQSLRVDFTELPVLVRINGCEARWYGDDLDVVRNLPFAAIMLPKAELSSATELLLDGSVRIVALIETARGLAEARAIAAMPGVERLAFGSIDYSADMGCAHDHAPLAHARSEIVLASRLADLMKPLDGVTADLEDESVLELDVRRAREFGFGGKMCVHPKQVGVVKQTFGPTADEVAWARKVLASGDGATMVAGTMVDEPVRKRARDILRQRPAGQ